jgi:hypothetical protein
MTTAAAFSVANRLAEVLHHLGIESAHFAVSVVTYITGFPQAHPERIASLTLVCPPLRASQQKNMVKARGIDTKAYYLLDRE